jgi:hypothetical protein
LPTRASSSARERHTPSSSDGGPLLHAYALAWVDRHAGDGHDTVREFTRSEYRRLLITYAFAYFAPDKHLGDLSRDDVHGLISWVTHRPGRHGRLSDQSIANSSRRCAVASSPP